MHQKDLYVHYKLPEIQEQYITGLKLANSLKGGELTPFIPIKGRQIKFYYCGPTVYSNSHLGHARTYLGIDVIKRTLRDYLKYDLITVMNITDIDDKIIAKSNEEKKPFLEFTKLWEQDFFNSMGALNIELPEVITRVSDYIPEIVEFIQKIISNGYAYDSHGSVYFDVQKYQADGHSYPKMRPTLDVGLLMEGEGHLQSQTEKKHECDFALWKKSKPDEPKWVSPWGEGRPGWHIECSVMASAILGDQIDLHAGGIDLIFPHHDNSLAQAEACFNCHQWINYFIHLGHLNIDGLKMSKSLKNFLSIESVLQRYTARQVRLNFAIHQYDAVMNYSEHAMSEAIAKDRTYMEFFQNIRAYERNSSVLDNQKWLASDFKLNDFFVEKKSNIHQAILENFNYPQVMKELDELINHVNTEMAKKSIKLPMIIAISTYVAHIFGLLGINYTKDYQKELEPIMAQFCQLRDQVKGHAKKGEFEQIEQLCNQPMNHISVLVNRIIDIYNQFMQEVKQASQEKSKQKLFNLCDKVRDDTLMDQGIKLEDKQDTSIWKQYDPKELKLEKEQIIQLKLQKEEEQKQKELLKKQQEQEKLNKQKINPKEMFINQKDKYSEFDDNGIPTKDIEGKVIDGKIKNKLQQEWNAQKKLYTKYIEKQQQQQEK